MSAALGTDSAIRDFFGAEAAIMATDKDTLRSRETGGNTEAVQPLYTSPFLLQTPFN
ncbi:unnamed protein product [marine sediment metagenome]|uniref:Uncharacterized protein n=1 Tax=marine sediment metagenome TaxID=412755 RepID=X0UH20_9ZZZZ